MKRGPSLPLTSGDEQDAFTGWRRLLHWQAGARKRIKRAWNRRMRRASKPDASEYESATEDVRMSQAHEGECHGHAEPHAVIKGWSP